MSGRRNGFRPGLPLALALAALTGLAAPEAVQACAVCFGGAESDMTSGMNNGILTLLAIVGLVQVGFVALFGSIWFRSRRLKRHRERFHLLEGGR